MPPVALSPGAYAGRIGESIPIVGRNLSSVVDRFMIIGRYMRIVFCSSTEKRDEAREGGEDMRLRLYWRGKRERN